MIQSKKDFSQLTEQERIKLVDDIIIRYPFFDEVIQTIEEYHFRNKENEPDCLFVGGETGSGKTTIMKIYEDRYPRKITEEGTNIPVLCSMIPAKATIRGTASKLLWDLGDPAWNRGSVDTMTNRLVDLANDCKVELIFLDELNHLIDRDSEKLLKLVSDWLKELILESNKPVVAFGLSKALDVLSPNTNAQLSRRFTRRIALLPFSWKDSNNNNGEDFRKFLFMVESKLPLMELSALGEEYMARRFYYATDGNIAHIMTLIRHGVRLALKLKQESLSLDILSTVFDQHIKNAKPYKKVNPFITDSFDLEEVIENSNSPKTQTSTNSGSSRATNNRLKSKKRSLSASDVLH